VSKRLTFADVQTEINAAPARLTRGFQSYVAEKKYKSQQAVGLVLSGRAKSRLIEAAILELWPKWKEERHVAA
jgi:hypothetical protein